jgi:hypothetical protein
MARRLAFMVLTVALALALGSTSVLSQGGKVAMLLPGSVNDQSWNAAGYAGLLKLKDTGMEIAYSENVQAADHVEAMKDYARRGFSPVIGHSGRFLSRRSGSARSSARRPSSSVQARVGRATSSRSTSPTSSTPTWSACSRGR